MTRRNFITTGVAATGLTMTQGCSSSHDHTLCDYLGAKNGRPVAFNVSQSPREAYQLLKRMCNEIGIRPDFELQDASYTNGTPVAQAMHSGRFGGGEKIMRFDRAYFDWSDSIILWHQAMILCHELGHHVGSHIRRDPRSRHDLELEADGFAGFGVARLGGTMQQATRFTSLMSEEGSKSHPPRVERIAAIREGWRLGKRISSS